MFINKFILIVVCALALSACGEIVIDGSSDAKFSSSFKEMYDGLDPDQQAKLEEAAFKVTAHSIFNQSDLDVQEARHLLDGKSFEQILSYAESLEGSGISGLNGKTEKSPEPDPYTLEQISKVKIIKSEFLIEKVEGMSFPILTIGLTNNSELTVSKVRVSVIYKSPGRKVAWADDEVYFQISGGLEPTESNESRLSWGRWEYLEVDDNAEVLATIIELVDHNGKSYELE